MERKCVDAADRPGAERTGPSVTEQRFVHDGRQCMAVGYSYTTGAFGSGGNFLAERWNGTAWTLDGVTTPAADLAPNLSGVSCTSATFCMAVGDYYTALSGNSLLGETGISETWNGAAWALHTIADPADSLFAGRLVHRRQRLHRSRRFLVPTGTGGSAPESAEGWNGTKWATETTVEPGSGSWFFGITCSASKTCTGVG